LDLYVEFRLKSNGLPLVSGRRLPGAMIAHGLDGMATEEKDAMIALIQWGGYSASDKLAILDYCQRDVDGLAALLPRMLPAIVKEPRGLGQALLRGRYMAAIARMEWVGIPVDLPILRRMRWHWGAIKEQLIAEVDQDFQVYDGTAFREAKFRDYLTNNGIPWPLLESGRLDLKDDTFREMARAHPRVAPLRELRHALGELRLADLAVSHDGRNRTLLAPFSSRTGRNQPSNTKYIFGPAVWLRSLIRPDPGRVLCYLDWSAQEVAIAAALSGDSALIEAVRSGDCYLSFAKSAKLAPADATKATHGTIRDQCKACVLGVNYGMGEQSLAYRIGASVIEARDLLELHQRTYPRFWRWSNGVVDHAMLYGALHTRFGWVLHTGFDPNPRALRNFPMQANGAEMLRLACIFATEAGVQVVAPVHDAVLVEASVNDIDAAVLTMRAAMARASREVLDGFEVGVEEKRITWPHCYFDPRGVVMWRRVRDILRRVEMSGRRHHWGSRLGAA
jgi:DNA polymerase I